MLTIYDFNCGTLTKREGLVALTEGSVWLDLLDPTPAEDKHVEAALGIEIPTRAEAREIEASSRLYVENGAQYMTTYIMHGLDQANPGSSNLTFILSGKRLVTVRYCEPKAFPFFLQRVDRGEARCTSGPAIMIGLLETLLHRKADLIERIQDEVDKMAQSLFNLNGTHKGKQKVDFSTLLKGTGRGADIIARAQESAVSIDRALTFFSSGLRDRTDEPDLPDRIDAARRDNTSLMEHMKFLQGRTNFLLDATLGMINTEQNQIIKLFSVMAVMLMPPTLIASIYGMNFKHIPEFEFQYGYPMALGLMLLAGVIPFIYFRRKGWL
ncbi:MAG: magnesium transporter CorA family protein [Hyphomicrobiaceae bacterium]